MSIPDDRAPELQAIDIVRAGLREFIGQALAMGAPTRVTTVALQMEAARMFVEYARPGEREAFVAGAARAFDGERKAAGQAPSMPTISHEPTVEAACDAFTQIVGQLAALGYSTPIILASLQLVGATGFVSRVTAPTIDDFLDIARQAYEKAVKSEGARVATQPGGQA